MKVGELFFEIGGKFDKLSQGLNDAKKQVAIFAAEVTATLYILDRFVESSTKGAFSLSTMAKQAGATTQELQKFGLAASFENVGISAEEASAQVAGFAKNLYNLQHFGTGSSEGFNTLSFMGKGIAFAGKDAIHVLGELRERIRGLDDQTAINVLEKFGFGAQFLEVMRLSNAEFDKRAKGLERSDAQISALKRTGIAVAELKASLTAFKDSVVVDLEPVWQGLIKGLYEALKLFKSLSFFVKDIYEGFGNLSDATQKWAQVIGVVLLAALAPVTAALASILLLIDDYVAYKSGGKSVIGSIKEGLPKFGSNGGSLINPDNLTMDDLSRRLNGDESVKKSAEVAMPPIKVIPMKNPEAAEGVRGLFDIYGTDGKPYSAGAAVTVNNNIQVHGTDPHAIAGAIADKTQQQLNHALSDQNNGSAY